MRLVWPDRTPMPTEPNDPADDSADQTQVEKTIPTDEVVEGKAPADADAPAAEQPFIELPDGSVPPEESPEAADEAEDVESDADTDLNLAIIEALIFSTHHPLTPQRIAELLEVKSQKAIKRAIHALNGQYEHTGRSFRVEQVAGGYQLLSLPEFGDYLKRLHQKEIDSKLTKAALETLAIIAYKQPILRADVEAIRGVACGETIRSLMEKHLVKIDGRAEEPGRPILYGTTKRFLELFGLNSVKDLPQSDDSALPPPKEQAEA